MTRVEPLSSCSSSSAAAAASYPHKDAMAASDETLAATAVTPFQDLTSSQHKACHGSSVATTTTRRVDTAQHGVVLLGDVAYTMAWLGIYTLHAVCAAYLISAGFLYAELPATQVADMLLLYQLALEVSYFQTIAYVHYAVAAAHCYVVAKPVGFTIGSWLVPQTTRYRLSVLQRGISQRLSSSMSISSSSGTGVAMLRSAHSTLSRQTRRVYRTLLASDGLFGVHNQYFELLFLFREVVETALQSYQGYNMSRLLPHMSLNRFYTIMLIVNCFTTPVLRRIFSKNRSLQRLLVVLCDIVLDFVSSIGVPVVVAASYIAQYDPESKDFAPWTVWYDDLWLLKFVNEAPLVLFGSWLDAVSRLVFSVGLLSSMGDVKSLIQRRNVAAIAPLSTDVPLDDQRKTSTLGTTASRHSSALTLLLRKPEHQATLSKWVHRLLVLWGLAIAGVFLQAQLRSSAQYCGLELRPWLVQKPACGIVKIDCNVHPEISGTTQQVDRIFDAIDAGSVEHVFFRHCLHVEIPDQFRNFHNLYGFKTYNSTIVSWAPDAAFTSQNHPRVRFAFFIMTQFPNGELPSGLLHPEFPQTLSDIEFCGSNLRTLPDTLPWPMTSTIYVELSQLQAFPLVLSRLKPFSLSLAYNQIHEFPAEAIMTPDIRDFTLRGNPIVELPESGVDISRLHHTGTGVTLAGISIENTNISTLPAWITAQFMAQVNIRAGGSALCTTVLLQVDSLARETLLAERPWLSQINCWESGMRSNYPIELDTEMSG